MTGISFDDLMELVVHGFEMIVPEEEFRRGAMEARVFEIIR